MPLKPRGTLSRSADILEQIEDTERVTAQLNTTPRGRLRVAASITFGHAHIVDLVPKFLAEYPGITLDLMLSDAMVDLVEEGIDLAVIPIGDNFTMGPEDAIKAVKLLRPKKVVPCHYNTWPPIEQDPDAWAEKVEAETDAQPFVLKPGESLTL